MDYYDIDNLYNIGKLPLRYYNQLNGKSLSENYKATKQRNRQKKKEKDFVEKSLEDMEKIADKAFQDFLKQKFQEQLEMVINLEI